MPFTSPKDCTGTPLYDSPQDERSFKFFEEFIPDLKELAREAIEECHLPVDEIVLLCIEECPLWEDLIESLCLESDDTSESEDDEFEKVMLSLAMAGEINEYLTAKDPVYQRMLKFKSPPPPGMIRLIILAEDGRVMIRDLGIYTPKVQ